MKIYMTLLAQVFFIITGFSQNPENVYEKKGNIYVTLHDGSNEQVTFGGLDSQPKLSNDKSFVVFVRSRQREITADEYVSGERVETKLVMYELRTKSLRTLVQGCKNENEPANIFIKDSDSYPFDYLCGISTPHLAKEGDRIYFSSKAWAVADAIHYYDLKKKSTFFFCAGDLVGLDNYGNVMVRVSGIDTDKGRYLQDWLLDPDGAKLKSLGEKKF